MSEETKLGLKVCRKNTHVGVVAYDPLVWEECPLCECTVALNDITRQLITLGGEIESLKSAFSPQVAPKKRYVQ